MQRCLSSKVKGVPKVHPLGLGFLGSFFPFDFQTSLLASLWENGVYWSGRAYEIYRNSQTFQVKFISAAVFARVMAPFPEFRPRKKVFNSTRNPFAHVVLHILGSGFRAKWRFLVASRLRLSCRFLVIGCQCVQLYIVY